MPQVTTNGQIQNLTDSDLNHVISKDWQGHVVEQYISPILPKSTVPFQHVGNQNAGSEAAVVYRIKNKENKNYIAIVAWSNDSNSPKKVYTLVAVPPTSYTEDYWRVISDDLHNSSNSSFSILDGCTSKVQIGDGDSPPLSAAISYAD
ncbi:uncharacterized protein LOC111295175 [Durio zibethinus]|uniref:Uncharacterized protein LOC111295175 n=1 Tax=Durio zibethinus TaxID=66656 RepID=A0A6P5YVN9_DURZI|nr:uncharacterized protein LOC111295175 [Durio zibethinus]